LKIDIDPKDAKSGIALMMYIGKIEITYKKKIFAHRKEGELYTWRYSWKP
jgi:hypothetical protein